MSELHKGSKNIGLDVESEEGERGPLCSNKANVRSPSFEVESDIFPEETIFALKELGELLREIQAKLRSQGIDIYDDDDGNN